MGSANISGERPVFQEMCCSPQETGKNSAWSRTSRNTHGGQGGVSRKHHIIETRSGSPAKRERMTEGAGGETIYLFLDQEVGDDEGARK